ncbi:MAG: biotin--[acetyl-CoA-carboxylase] ligase [Paracoccaceae bacterium]|nr:biotin--[acetyl-CoA-carboxylase] ligase [Paracoccaceae bacterium]
MTEWPGGYDRLILDEIDSTNEEARRRVPAPRPIWIAARRQSAARGRQGRAWEAPEGNLSATLLIARDDAPSELARFTFHASLAVADLLAHFVPDAQVQTKWPNDALLNGKKAAGILLENSGAGGGRQANLAIGIGINLAHHPDPETSRWPPTSLAAETGHAPEFENALTVLARRFDHWLAVGDFAVIRAEWLSRTSHLGKKIEARLPDRVLTGIFEDVDAEGTLVLRTPGGIERIAAADIFFPE